MDGRGRGGEVGGRGEGGGWKQCPDSSKVTGEELLLKRPSGISR